MYQLSQEKSLEVAQSNYLKYISQLDGNKRPLDEQLFDNIFHEDITGMADGHRITRIQLKEIV